MELEHRTGNLFDVLVVEKGAILGHAVNCKGVWGSGIAVEFKRRFPAAFESYQDICRAHALRPQVLCGQAKVLPDPNGWVACLFTSKGYGGMRDTVPEILDTTKRAVRALAVGHPGVSTLHIPRINSGNFGVPWKRTERTLRELEIETLKLVVWTP